VDNGSGKTHKFSIRNHQVRRVFLLLAGVCLVQPSWGQAPAAKGAVDPGQGGAAKEGTRIIGEQEVPPGLYIMSWRDVPAPRMQDPAIPNRNQIAQPIDPDVLARELNYGEAASANSNR